MRSFISGLVAVLSLFGSASAIAHEQKWHVGHSRHAHENIATRNETTQLAKRFDGAKLSFFDAGLGACGKVNSNSDYIVALNTAQWDGGSHCFEMITISYKGKSMQAQITDLCPTCPYGGLDLSRGLFYNWATEEDGIIYGTWNYGGGASEEPKSSSTPPEPAPTPKFSSKEVPTSTPTQTPTSTKSSTKQSPTSTSKASVSSSSVASTSKSQATMSTSTSESVASTVLPGSPSSDLADNLIGFNQAFLQMARLIGAGAS